MTPRVGLAIGLVVALGSACASGGGTQTPNARLRQGFGGQAGPRSGDARLFRDLDEILSDPVLSRALVGVRVDSLRTDSVLYQRNSDKLVVPASNMKLLTLAVAAERLGWDHQFETRLESAGAINDGTLTGDLVVVGGGDPAIESPDFGHPALFLEWAEALQAAGIRRVQGRLIGDDNAFDDQGLGAGWAWDYLADGYAAASGALSYNNNVVTLRLVPGQAEGGVVTVELAPAGHLLTVENRVKTGPAGSRPAVTVARFPGTSRLMLSGTLPAGGAPFVRTTTVDNPTRYFVEALLTALAARGIPVSEGAWDIDDITRPIAQSGGGLRLTIARRQSPPLSSLGAQMMKTSQNFYGEMLLKAIGRTADRPGSAAAGRDVVRATLGAWGIGSESFVMNDGSGLSRYDYVTADAVVALLNHVWRDETLRGPFVAALPVGAHDGTLETRMRNTALDRRVQAKTGTISNMRSLSGFLETDSGERLVFSIIVNHFTASNAEIDAVVERLLLRLMQR